MLTENSTERTASSAALLLSQAEGTLFGELMDNLPEGWVVDIEADAGMAWVAYVHCAEAPRSRPLFTVCRWSDRVGLFVQWTEGSTSSTVDYTELWPILDLIRSSIFASTVVHLATVSTEGWCNTQH